MMLLLSVGMGQFIFECYLDFKAFRQIQNTLNFLVDFLQFHYCFSNHQFSNASL